MHSEVNGADGQNGSSNGHFNGANDEFEDGIADEDLLMAEAIAVG